MRSPSLKTAIVVGLISSLPLLAISYLGNAVAGLSFLPFDLFDWLTRVLPGSLVTTGIDSMVGTLQGLGFSVRETAKLAEQTMAISLVVAMGPFVGLLTGLAIRWRSSDIWFAATVAASPFFLLFFLAELGLGFEANPLLALLWLALLTVGWAVTVAYVLKRIQETDAEDDSPDQSRRDILLKFTGAAAGLTLGAWGLGRLARDETASVVQQSGAGQPLPTQPPVTPGATTGATPSAAPQSGAGIPSTPSGRISMPPGVRPEVTSNEEFYRIDINTRPPVIDGTDWQLDIGGLFQNPRNLTIDDLMAYPAVTQPLTMSCISNRIGGDLIGTSYWTGVRLRDVLEDLQLAPEAGALHIEAEDGFYETVIAEDMMDERTLLVFGMNGETLPVEHGYPLRIYIPNRYGMKQPKWIVRMEAIEAWQPGYWVERGWSREARPQIVSVVDTVATDATSNGMIPVGGIAWAGDRGIEKVEVRVDDGPWQEAQLRTPPISGLTWVQWRYDWPSESGRHTFAVRATDGTGAVQTDERNDPHPDGATGYHSKTANV